MPRSRRSLYGEDYRALLELLVKERKKAGVKQVALAKSMSTSQSMLSKLERRVVRMDLLDLFAYLEGIGQEPTAFVRSYSKMLKGRKALKSR